MNMNCKIAMDLVELYKSDVVSRETADAIREHLKEDGAALICTMGNGEFEMQTDIREAFEPRERDHRSGKMTVAATSCRMVSFETFERELSENGLRIAEKGMESIPPEFDSLMYAVVRRK